MEKIQTRAAEIYCVTYKGRTGLVSSFYTPIIELDHIINARENSEVKT